MWFDFHWHGRDLNERHKDTLERALALAEAVGLTAMAFMPNTDPPLITEEDCMNYLKIADRCGSKVHTYAIIAFTVDPEQNKRAAEAIMTNPRIIAGKTYRGRSTNPSISVISSGIIGCYS